MVEFVVAFTVTTFLGWAVWQQYQIQMEKYNQGKEDE